MQLVHEAFKHHFLFLWCPRCPFIPFEGFTVRYDCVQGALHHQKGVGEPRGVLLAVVDEVNHVDSALRAYDSDSFPLVQDFTQVVSLLANYAHRDCALHRKRLYTRRKHFESIFFL